MRANESRLGEEVFQNPSLNLGFLCISKYDQFQLREQSSRLNSQLFCIQSNRSASYVYGNFDFGSSASTNVLCSWDTSIQAANCQGRHVSIYEYNGHVLTSINQLHCSNVSVYYKKLDPRWTSKQMDDVFFPIQMVLM